MSAQAIAQNALPNATFQAFFPGLSQTLVTSGASQQSAAWAPQTTIIRVFAEQDCFLDFGSNPTATTSKMFMPGGFTEYFAVTPSTKLSVIQSTTSGNLRITEGL